ncbi:hypothetical protein [Streptomyces sp. NPDC097619]|uniref:hypothetical protein n=1 Tax=Streptomyces sp. NPDC097619 TaxID=3157228 RepID=UPI003330BB53
MITTTLRSVPGVLARTDRRPRTEHVVLGPEGVRFPGGRRADQVDEDGILWRPWTGPDTGPVLWNRFDDERQRELLDRLLCAHCGREPDRTEAGMLWLLPATEAFTSGRDALTTIPPICRPHADRALALCPELGQGHTAVRVRRSDRWGVRGTVHHPDGTRTDEDVPFTDPMRIRRTVAHQLIRRLWDSVPSVPDRPLHEEVL